METAKERKTRLQANLKAIQAEKKTFKTEGQEQPLFLAEFRKAWPDVLIFSIPNGANAGPREKSRLKTQGLVSGVPDLFVPAWHLFIELKQTKSGKTSEKQDIVMDKLRVLGYTCYVAFGAVEAMAACTEVAERQAKQDGG